MLIKIDNITKAVLELPHAHKGTIFFSPSELMPTDNGNILIPLEQERSLAGEALVNALWFDKEVRLYLDCGGENFCYALRPWRCHIVGSCFSAMLERVRRNDPRADIAVVWELKPLSQLEASPLPGMFNDTVTGEPEQHLDILLK